MSILPDDQAALIMSSVQDYLLKLEPGDFREEQIKVAQTLYADLLGLHLSDDGKAVSNSLERDPGEIQSEILENVMGVEEASELWGLSAGYIKNLCAAGQVVAKKIGHTWIIDKQQPRYSGGGKNK